MQEEGVGLYGKVEYPECVTSIIFPFYQNMWDYDAHEIVITNWWERNKKPTSINLYVPCEHIQTQSLLSVIAFCQKNWIHLTVFHEYGGRDGWKQQNIF